MDWLLWLSGALENFGISYPHSGLPVVRKIPLPILPGSTHRFDIPGAAQVPQEPAAIPRADTRQRPL